MSERSLAEVDLEALCARTFHPSPVAWEDEVMYFLLPDRFSDDKENLYRDVNGNVVTTGTTPPYDEPVDWENAIRTLADRDAWMAAGSKFGGGTLNGVKSKIGYLRRLGVTVIWLGPVLKQVAHQDTYHGYGIQNFLDVDRHFGSRDDLVTLVKECHANGIHVVLDIVLNHAGNVFGYNPDRYCTQAQDGTWYLDPRWDGRAYDVAGFRDGSGGIGSLGSRRYDPSNPNPPGWPDGAVWPGELQDLEVFTRKGRICTWDCYPEYLEGDFGDMKDIALGADDCSKFRENPAAKALCDVYKFWIAFADLDGFRVDTVKHMGHGPTRYLTSVIHEFCQSIGKENFYLIGEVTGTREQAFDTVDETGLDAALGIADVQEKLEYLPKGRCNPSDYFDIFTNALQVGKESHAWFRNKVVTMLDDHDKVRNGIWKKRYCADGRGDKSVLCALAINATTLGIPCIYYGSEQAFDGQGGSDRYIREAMFGGKFGGFRSQERHFFNETHPVYVELAKILAVRAKEPALRRGRQFLRPISGGGTNFGLPMMWGGQIRSIVSWSRIFVKQEVMLAVNTDVDNPSTAWVTIDDGLHQAGDKLTCLYSTDSAQVGTAVTVEKRNGKAVQLTLPAAGFVIYK